MMVNLEICRLRGPSNINKSSERERILQKNNKHGLRTKDFNNNVDTLILDPIKYTIIPHKPKVDSVNFIGPY